MYDRHESLPEASQLDVLVILGGPMGSLDDRDHWHLASERDPIARCVGQGRPVLGVCLGAQLLAAALGARVTRGPAIEVGAGTATLTPDGLTDPVFGPSGPELPMVHWHEDTFELPEGGVLLASSEQYAHQAFRVGESYGLQFHVELDADALDRLAPYLPTGTVVPPGSTRAAASVGNRCSAAGPTTRVRRQVTGRGPGRLVDVEHTVCLGCGDAMSRTQYPAVEPGLPLRWVRTDRAAAQRLLDRPEVLPVSWGVLLRKRLDGHLDDQTERLHGSASSVEPAQTMPNVAHGTTKEIA
ncbi:MAG TPA: type 1 glutamine amidotransferase [Nonomuraea sp.]|nr:type 1 glutamine amidotransferase [Nonomuraea sp.]